MDCGSLVATVRYYGCTVSTVGAPPANTYCMVMYLVRDNTNTSIDSTSTDSMITKPWAPYSSPQLRVIKVWNLAA